jgi:hypothetical protein
MILYSPLNYTVVMSMYLLFRKLGLYSYIISKVKNWGVKLKYLNMLRVIFIFWVLFIFFLSFIYIYFNIYLYFYYFIHNKNNIEISVDPSGLYFVISGLNDY